MSFIPFPYCATRKLDFNLECPYQEPNAPSAFINEGFNLLKSRHQSKLEYKENLTELFKTHILTSSLVEQRKLFLNLQNKKLHQNSLLKIDNEIEVQVTHIIKQIFLYRTLKLALQNLSLPFITYFPLFTELSEKQKFQVGKVLANYHPHILCTYIQELNFNDSKQRLKLAQLASVHAPLTLYRSLNKFELHTEEERFALLAEWIQHIEFDSLLPATNLVDLKQFEIKNFQNHIEILKTLQTSDYAKGIFYLWNISEWDRHLYFKITIELIKTASEDTFRLFSPCYLFPLPIEQEWTQTELIEIILATCKHSQRDYEATTFLKECLKKFFPINDFQYESVLKALIRYKPSTLVQVLEKFPLSDQQKFEVYRKVIKLGTDIEFLDHYSIGNPELLYTLAKTAIKFIPLNEMFIERFKLDTPEKLYEIARLASQKGGLSIEQIKICGLDSPQVLLELALLTATSYPALLANEIDNYQFTEAYQRLELFLKIFSCDITHVKMLPKFNISSLEHWSQIFEAWRNFYSFVENQSTEEMLTLYTSTEAVEYIQRIILTILEDNFRELCPYKRLWEEISPTFEILRRFPIDREDDRLKLFKMTVWLTYAISYTYLKQPQATSLAIGKILYELLEHPNSKLRYELIDLLLEKICPSIQLHKLYSDFTNNKPKHMLIPSLVICGLAEELTETSTLYEIAALIEKKRKIFRDARYIKPLLDTLKAVMEISQKKLSAKDKIQLLLAILKQTDKEKIKSALLNTQGLIQCKYAEKLNTANLALHHYNFNLLHQQVFEELFQTDQIVNFDKFYYETFAQCREPSSLLVYAGKIKSTSEAELLMKLLSSYVQGVLTENSVRFYEERYKEDLNPHLQKLFLNRNLLKKEWVKGYRENFQIYLQQNPFEITETEEFSFANFLKQKLLLDKHLPPKEYPTLVKYLSVVEDEAKVGLIKELKEQMDKTLLCTKSEQLENRLHKLNLEQELIKILKENLTHNQLLQNLKKIKDLIKQIPGLTEFQNDIKALIESLQHYIKREKAVDYSSYTICDTDHYWDLLRVGSDVTGSCQRVDGSPELNKCLLGYIMDGEDRILAIKDSTGLIKARCIIRLLLENNKPVLFQERIYPTAINPRLRYALNLLAKLRAKDLELPLYTTENMAEKSGIGSTDNLTCLGGRSLWKYVDAIGGMHRNGIFKITNSYLIYDPKNQTSVQN
ncbi:MAG: hypothetical protein K0S74_1766 [Chlamydiales bacterium]|jgi:hypothetical protein|nr:hypothetical protein [Chlamydiales bacterium]